MKCLIILVLYLSFEFVLSNPTNSLVVSTTESTIKEFNNNSKENAEVADVVNPQIYSMNIHTNISNRFATTLITSKVKNLKKIAAETTFSILLPENAFVSEFVMEIDGKEYKAYVKEKEEAKKIYEDAVASGRGAAHVELSARDSKTFTVSVNIEPESKTIFKLTYEELLQRQLGRYELVVNINPGQIVEDLSVEVHINESRPLIFVETPSLRTGNEISKNDENLKPSAEIDVLNSTSATVKFKPDEDQQKHFAGLLGSNKEDGFAGQFVVQYDVERDPHGGEVLIRDGYFVHFFSPSELEPLPKHVVFVLDHSGSMSGRKIEQLIEAMQNILSELNPNDLLNIVRFAESASVWNITENKFDHINLINIKYGHLEPELRELNLPEAVEATEENLEKAKNVIKVTEDMGLTNIIEGLEVGLYLTKKTQEKFPKKYQPMIIFLTDGQANVGMHSGEEITETVNKLNSGSETPRASIFSLSFGYGADKNFLRKLSSNNLGFSKHIYEAADASLQLQDFYRKISSPLLSNVTFKYVDGVTDVTKTHYPLLFNGSELVVAGRTNNFADIFLYVNGLSRKGLIQFKPVKEEPVSSVERLWAYLTVQQLLKDREVATNKTDLTKKALDIALKYSFVTSVTSLVVVKPNKTESADDTAKHQEDHLAPLPVSAMLPTSSGIQYNLRGGFYGPPRRQFASSHPMSYIPPPPRPMAPDASQIYPQASLGIVSPLRPYGPPAGKGAFGSPGFPSGPPQFSGQPGLSAPKTIPYVPISGSPPGQIPTTVNTTLPQWIKDLRDKNEDILAPQGNFKVGQFFSGNLPVVCPQTPLNSTGYCTNLFHCNQVFSLLTDVNVYLQYFCPYENYAGICCPSPQQPVQIP